MESETPPFDQFVDLQTLWQDVKLVFETEASIRWFVRRHRTELVARKALIVLVGRWKFHPENFKNTVVDIGFNTAQLGHGVVRRKIPGVGRNCVGGN